MALPALEFRALGGLPEFGPGDDLAAAVHAALSAAGISLRAGDVLVVAQKVVSKVEGRYRRLSEVQASPRAEELARVVGKDPRFVELVLRESSEVLRASPNVLITRHRRGHVMANSGIDRSNLPPGSGSADERVLLLPEDPDGSARRLASALGPASGGWPAVIVSDSFGRPWRQGTVNVALGVWGLPAVVDRRGEPDRHGRILQTTQVALADALAAAAGLAMGEGAEGTPVVHARGLGWSGPATDSTPLIRPLAEDLFR